MTELLQALLTPLVAVVTTYIAYQQYRIRRDERALALYDRRLAVFKSAVSALDRIRACNAMTTDDALTWLSSVAEAQFLFGEEVQLVMDRLFAEVYGYAVVTDPCTNGKDFDLECVEAVAKVERYRNALMAVFTPYLRPVGSRTRRKRHLSLKDVAALLPAEDTEDIPY